MKCSWLPLSLALLALGVAPAWAAAEAPAPAEPAPAPTVTPESGSCAGGASASALAPVAVSTGGITAQSFCQANCSGILISCSGLCDTCNTLRWFQTEDCCPNNFHVMEERRCTPSGWVNTGNTDCLVQCEGGGPL